MRDPEGGPEGGQEEGVQVLSTPLSVGSILNLEFDIFGYVYTKLFSCLQWKIHYTHILKFLLHHCSENPRMVNSEYK